MAFPAGLSNGQTTTINGVVYVYSATDNAWTRVSTPFGNLAINGNLSANIATFTGNLYANANIITSNVFLGNLYWSNGSAISFSTYSNSNVAAYLPVYSGDITAATLSVGTGIQTDVLNLNNNNLYNVNTIRINDPGASEGIAWEGGSGWNIYESPNDLSNNIGNLQIVLSGVRALTVDTNQTVNIPSTWRSTSTTTGALTVGGGVGIAGNLYVGGNINIAGSTFIVNSTINNQVTGNLLVGSPITFTAFNANVQYGGNQDSYLQLLMQNANNGSNASTDFVAAADNAASDTDTYIDMGINSSTYSQAGYSATFPNDGYLYVQGNTTTGGGNLILATMTNRDIIFTTGGQNANNEVMRITSGNVVQITNNQSSTSTTTGALVVAGGTGIAGNAYVGGNVVVTSNVSANKFYTTEGLYWSGNGVAFSSGGGGGGTVDYVASSTAPVSPDNGDFWYQTTTGILFQYLSDGTTSYWFDTQTETVSGVAYTNANVETYVNTTVNILSPFLLAGM